MKIFLIKLSYYTFFGYLRQLNIFLRKSIKYSF
jgi:hypothetical protein